MPVVLNQIDPLQIVTSVAYSLGVIFGPVLLFMILIHWLEKLVQLALAERFGWSSVLWTGWLGTPVHELSHVVACLLFRHRIDEVSFFEPDLKAGRLGFVRHSWRKGNWFEELGNTFIGLAPLAGGSLVLLIMFRLFYPDLFSDLVNHQGTEQAVFTGNAVQGLAYFIQPEIVSSIKFWIFVYLVFCVGCHMAPSPSDYRGAGASTFIIVSLLILSLGIVSGMGVDLRETSNSVFKLLSPLYLLLGIVSVLCVATTAIVWTASRLFPKRYEVV